MKTRNIIVAVLAGLLVFSSSFCENEKDDETSLTKAIGITEICGATVIYSPHMNDRRGSKVGFTSDSKQAALLYKLLSEYPAKGDAYISFSEDIPCWTIYLYDGKDRYTVKRVSILGHTVQSPVNGTMLYNAKDPQDKKLMKLLHEMIQSAEKAD